jgi:Tol biopolymer transport system component
MMDEFLIEKPDEESELLWLIQQCQDGIPQAVEGLVNRYGEQVSNLTGLLLPIQDDLEPVIIEIFADILQKLGLYSEAIPFEQWITQSIFKVTHQAWQQRSTEKDLPGGLAALDATQRDAILLTHTPDFDLEKTARILGLTAEATSSQAALGLQNLEENGFTTAALQAYLEDQKHPSFYWDAETILRIATKADNLSKERKRRFRQRLLIFEIIWVVTGLLWLTGAFHVANTIGEGQTGPASTFGATVPELLDLNLTPTREPTPIRTPLPYESTQANGPSSSPAISADGRYIVFASKASNLVVGDTNEVSDIFLFDRLARTMRRLSLSSSGEQANGSSIAPNISADGTQVVFVSWASNLLETEKQDCKTSTGNMLPCADVYLKNLETNGISLISQQSGKAGDGDSGLSPSIGMPAEAPTISSDGNKVAFYSRAENLGADSQYGGLFLYDQTEDQLIRVDRTPDGQPVNGASSWPTLSGDGLLLAFQTQASNLVTDDLNEQADIFVYAVEQDQLVRITTGPTGTGANGPSMMPDLSADGRWLVFRSGADNLVIGDMNGVDDIFLHDLQDGVTGLVSVSNRGVPADNASNLPSISGDGGSISFVSLATNLMDRGFNGTWNLYLYDRLQIELQPVVRGLNGNPVNGPSSKSQLSGDGLFLVFASSASNLVPNDMNGVDDIFLYNHGSRTIQRINIPLSR